MYEIKFLDGGYNLRSLWVSAATIYNAIDVWREKAIKNGYVMPYRIVEITLYLIK